jgi:hypothetical protein
LIADLKFEPAGFAAPLGQKIFALRWPPAKSRTSRSASLLLDRFRTLRARGGDHLDWSAIGALAIKDSGGQ